MGQLYKISFSNFWCDKNYTLDEIHAINIENENAMPNEFTCLKTDGFVDFNRVSSADPSEFYQSEWNSSNSIQILYFVVCINVVLF